MSKKRRNSDGPFLAQPSTMFADAEYAARRICDVMPYNSDFGNDWVS